MKLAKFSVQNTNIETLKEVLDNEGYVILEDIMHSSKLEQLQTELEPHFDERKHSSEGLFWGTRTKRIEALLTKSDICQELVLNSSVFTLVDHLLGENCDSITLNLTQGIRIDAKEEAQILHPDSAMFPIEDKPFEFMANALWAYSDFTKENGATQLVPKSHKWEKDRMPRPEEITYAEMKAGSVLVYAASTLHGGGKNITDTPRTGLAMSYCLGWLRQSENQYLSYPPEIAKNFSPELQELIGYNVHRPNLGWVHGHNPKDLLTDENKEHLGAEDFLTDEQTDLLIAYKEDQNKALTSHNLEAA